MTSAFQLRVAATHILDGAVIVYPTEGVYGLGCAADDATAVARVVAAKGRDAAKGLILIAASAEQLQPWVAVDVETLPQRHSDQPITWIVAAAPNCNPLITGGRPTVAVRITDHPVAAGLARSADRALISTSANLSGQAAAVSALAVKRRLRGRYDYLVPGEIGRAGGASEIRDLASGKIIRPAATR